MGSDKETKEKKRKYNMSPEAYYQRTVAALKRGTTSKVWQDIINREDETGEWKELFMKYKLAVWAKLGSPLMFLAEQVAEMKAYIDMLLHNGKIDADAFMKYQRLLLDFVKELNKYKHVSADTKANLLKALVDEKKPLDVPVIELPKKGEEQDVAEN